MDIYKYNEKDLNWVKINKFKYLLEYHIIIITLFICLIFGFKLGLNFIETINKNNKEIENLKKENENLKGIIEIINESDSFNEDQLRLMLDGLNIKFIDIVIAQTILETGNYTSDIFLETGNLFGMKPAKIRPYTHYGEYKKHADYKGNWRLSVFDYALWQAREGKNIKTEDQYYFLLSKMYAEDEEYINKLKNIINNYK